MWEETDQGFGGVCRWASMMVGIFGGRDLGRRFSFFRLAEIFFVTSMNAARFGFCHRHNVSSPEAVCLRFLLRVVLRVKLSYDDARWRTLFVPYMCLGITSIPCDAVTRRNIL